MQFIDTHTHIYDEAFAGEEDAVILRAREAGVAVMLQPDVDSRERDAMFALVAKKLLLIKIIKHSNKIFFNL